jgi:PAS domain S-box-containing protein
MRTATSCIPQTDELSLLFENTDEVLWFADWQEQKLTRISNCCLQVYGYSADDFMQNFGLLKQVIHPEDVKVVDKIDELLKEGQQIKKHYRIIHKDGSVRYVAVKIVPMLNEDGELVKLCGMVKDITSQKRANKALQQSEYLYRQFFENTYEAIVVINASTGLIQDYNTNALNLFKTSGAEILSVTPAHFAPKYQPDGQKSAVKAANLIRHLIRERGLISEWVMMDSTGKEILCELNFTSVTNGSDTHIRISIVDITEKKQDKLKLMQQEFFYSKLLENIHDGVSLISATGEIIYQSPSAVSIMGRTLQDLEDTTIFDVVHPADISNLSALFALVHSNPGVPYTSQFRFRHKDGHYIWMEGTISNLLHDENIKAFIANYRNIEERKQAEAEIISLNESLEIKVKQRTAELQEANRELEAFNYTVSHDLQAPLRTTNAFAKMLFQKYAGKFDEEGNRVLQMINDSSTRMSQLIYDLLDFSKLGKQELVKRKVNMADMVKVVVEEVKNSMDGANFELVLKPLDEGVGDTGLLKQVWANLIGNAVKYSAKKNKPVIEIGCKYIGNETAYYIKDNGAGFDMKLAGKLFTVFKRMHNNEEFEGTGVGLATVQRIITRHGGRVWAEAHVNEGAVFYFTLSPGKHLI